ncbi:MAG: inner-rane translocator, partial [Actinomycetia bacterium]|nr:inner-rane translocator [Actinomycetes bacterium]
MSAIILDKVDRKALTRWVLALGGAAVVFGLLVLTKGANPFSVYSSMWTTITSSASFDGIFLKATPLILAALAVAVPAKAGLVNVGGEGQLVVGGVFAMGVSLAADGHVSGPLTLVLMCLAGALGGALWAAIAALLRLAVGINEAVSTLLLNYLAINLMTFLIFDRWKDREGSGQPV